MPPALTGTSIKVSGTTTGTWHGTMPGAAPGTWSGAPCAAAGQAESEVASLAEDRPECSRDTTEGCRETGGLCSEELPGK
mmetsp:Transcript_122095/g.380091  ORF Transcript_122095/g.380091 Transcript_122095/m.380091 type:complete len:80 (+) Transcript_122095:724-963(+)